MAKIQTSCPRCRQPILADIEQLFDVNVDPGAKQRLLSGAANSARCANCGYEGPLSTPLVYHDPEKELLLTYFPPELGLPVNEQERLIGPLINQVVSKLPNEKRKAYLFQPRTMLTFQTLIETILEKDGITRQMLDDQQKKISLLQRLVAASPESRAEMIRQDEALIDETFFTLVNRLIEATLAQGDEGSARQLAALQQELVKSTKVGQELQKQALEVQAAIKMLQDGAKDGGLTREKLLEVVVACADSEIRLSTVVSYTRSGMDYNFFQMLSDRVEASAPEERQKLIDLRAKLLEMTGAIDKQIEEELREARQTLEKILAAPDVEKATAENLDSITDFFLQALKTAMEDARQRGDMERIGKIQKVATFIEKASAPPPEVEFIQELMACETDEALNAMIQENAAKLTPEFSQILNSIMSQASQQEPQVAEQLTKVYRAVMRFAMTQNLKG